MGHPLDAPPGGSRSEMDEATRSDGSARRPGDRPSWTITKVASSGAIVLRFIGPTRTWETPEFLAALTEMIPDRNANIVFDLRELDGHNPDTKQPIKKWLIANKSRVANITVVVPRYATIHKVATAVIGLATGIKIKIRDDLDGETSVRDL